MPTIYVRKGSSLTRLLNIQAMCDYEDDYLEDWNENERVGYGETLMRRSKKRARPHDLWWMVDINKLDFEYYLPLFAHSLHESKYPFDIIARDGIIEMLDAAKNRVLGVLPQVVLGIKKALNTDIPNVIMNACAVIQKLTTLTPLVALALIKHYRMLLIPTFIKYLRAGVCFKGGEIDYGQRKRSLGKVIGETLDLLDRTGGPEAYVELRYAVPTFQSKFHNF